MCFEYTSREDTKLELFSHESSLAFSASFASLRGKEKEEDVASRRRGERRGRRESACPSAKPAGFAERTEG